MRWFFIVLIFNLITIYFCEVHREWVDPHEIVISGFNRNKHQKEECSCPPSTGTDKVSLIYYKRLINLLLRVLKRDKSDFLSYKAIINLQLNTESHDILKTFSITQNNEMDSLRKVDQILFDTLTKSITENILDGIVSWTDLIYYQFYNRTTGMLMGLLFISIISYKLLRAKFTVGRVFLYLVFLGWIIDFGFTWMKLYQEAEINQMSDSLRHRSVPAECDPSKMSIISYIWNSFFGSTGSKSECREYHQVRYKNILWIIGPLTVLSHQCGILIYTPATHIGKALGAFSTAILDMLPFYGKILVFPLLLIFAGVIMCMVISFATNTNFSFNILHLIQFKFGNHERKQISEFVEYEKRMITDTLSGENLTKFLTIFESLSLQNSPSQNVTFNSSSCENCEDRHSSDLTTQLSTWEKLRLKFKKPFQLENKISTSKNDKSMLNQENDKIVEIMQCNKCINAKKLKKLSKITSDNEEVIEKTSTKVKVDEISSCSYDEKSYCGKDEENEKHEKQDVPIDGSGDTA